MTNVWQALKSSLPTLKSAAQIVLSLLLIGGVFIGATRWGLDKRYAQRSAVEDMDKSLDYLVCRDRGYAMCACETHLPPENQICLTGGLTHADPSSP